MASLKISHTLLARALSDIIRQDSVGMADMEITAIHAVAQTGDLFAIDGLEVELASKRKVATASADKSGRFTPPAGVGKIRLATIDGQSI
jgi:hypothetical protein